MCRAADCGVLGSAGLPLGIVRVEGYPRP